MNALRPASHTFSLVCVRLSHIAHHFPHALRDHVVNMLEVLVRVGIGFGAYGVASRRRCRRVKKAPANAVAKS